MIKQLLMPLALTSMVGGAVLSASPAQAAQRDCTGNEFCLWLNDNYTGTRWYIGGDWDVGDCWNLPPSMNNKASSTYNTRARNDIAIYDGANCTTWLGVIDINKAYPELRSHGINDKITSIRFQGD